MTFKLDPWFSSYPLEGVAILPVPLTYFMQFARESLNEATILVRIPTIYLSFLPLHYCFPTMHCTFVSRKSYLKLYYIKLSNVHNVQSFIKLCACSFNQSSLWPVSLLLLHLRTMQYDMTLLLRLMCLLASFLMDDTQEPFCFLYFQWQNFGWWSR